MPFPRALARSSEFEHGLLIPFPTMIAITFFMPPKMKCCEYNNQHKENTPNHINNSRYNLQLDNKSVGKRLCSPKSLKSLNANYSISIIHLQLITI